MGIRTACVATAATLLISGPTFAWNVPMEKFENIPIASHPGVTLSLPEIREAMTNAGAGISARPWTMTDSGPGKMIARLDAGRRRHVIVMDLSYSATQYSLVYRSSTRMNYDADGTAHSSYNVWLHELVDHINAALAATVSAAARAPRPAPQAIAAATATAAQAGAPNAEIAFWESVRNSSNPAELQAYLGEYPNGTFAALARARLTGMGQAAPVSAPAAAVPTAVTKAAATKSASPYPAPGDTWTYRASFSKRALQSAPAPQTYIVKVRSSSQSEIVDEVSTETGAKTDRHSGGAYLVTQGVSIFSPYFYPLTAEAAPGTPLRRIETRDAACQLAYVCEAKGRVVARESIQTAAGRFDAIKIVVEQSWRAGQGASMGQSQMAQLSGGRVLTIWFAPEAKRAVRYQSRLVAGDTPPVEGNFDVELVKYELQ